MIEDLLKSVIDECAALDEPGDGLASTPIYNEQHTEYDTVPTLDPRTYQAISPMIASRFGLLRGWLNATHGDWLSIEEMEALWEEDLADERLRGIRTMRESACDNWSNEASNVFRPDRLTLFAGSATTNDKVYLLWIEDYDEPEVWVYDANGEARYKDLAAYLQAWLDDDLSAYSRTWILE